MKEKVIKTTRHKNIKFDGKLIFEANLGVVTVEGCIEADAILVRDGTNIYSRGNINSHGYINSGGNINSHGYINSGGYIYSRGYINSGGDINSRGYIYSGGYINSHGDINSGGYIGFSYHIKFKTKITCRLLRIAVSAETERSFWLEKYKLFGFKKMASIISAGCVSTLQPKHANLRPAYKKKLLGFKYWTATERMVIKSWLDGGLVNYEINK